MAISSTAQQLQLALGTASNAHQHHDTGPAEKHKGACRAGSREGGMVNDEPWGPVTLHMWVIHQAG